MLHAREFWVCCLRSGDTDCSGTFSALMTGPPSPSRNLNFLLKMSNGIMQIRTRKLYMCQRVQCEGLVCIVVNIMQTIDIRVDSNIYVQTDLHVSSILPVNSHKAQPERIGSRTTVCYVIGQPGNTERLHLVLYFCRLNVLFM